MAGEYLKSYVEFLRGFINPRRPVKVVFDCFDGAAGIILRHLRYPRLQFALLNDKPDGRFPSHGTDPLKPGALDQLALAVKKRQADLGVAFDADGDRAVFVDEKGESVEPYLVADLLCRHQRPPFIVDIINFESLKYSKLLRQGTFPSKVGTRFVKELMRTKKATIGAEDSGHYYFQDSFGSDDAILAAVKIINAVSRLSCPLSRLGDFLPGRISVRRFAWRVREPAQFLRGIRENYARKAKSVSEIDGVTMEFENGWFTVRPSNTEPRVRIFIGRRE